ncbi:gliding motility-associated C-terminal domain-containing protein [Xanthomarina sp. F2636L]|uniref:gliding motility-associated C-terminal domain-containing protein n=1 Tax=Xanthomarina sp. F2636L TaxID=2996018 RepID=UPI00225E1D9E|nr:gliding motility-associated C-terminal domain-containing protein [Xanthomarina sp. F2636L]MCX7549964.1 gliding motility-associated C-terminal domain-containing protein [Xanthomarina sp. F2636L]
MYQIFKYALLILLLTSNLIFSQEITLFEQFNGHYDYLAFGNTLNPSENNIVRDFCDVLPESQADLLMPSNTNIVAAYLFWAGSGEGDLEVSLNDTSILADNTYTVDFNDSGFGTLSYFSCYANITDLITSTGDGTYNLSNLDISETLIDNPGYCANRTNFAGWCVYVIYEDDLLPLNQVNLFQGLEIINRNVTEKIILLDNVNVLDNEGAKIGFLAWEGDANLNYGESLLINNNIISSPPLNPANNAFNGTNTFTNSNMFYNGDVDVYNIQDNIDIGDTSVEIKLTTGDYDANGNFQADLIIINNIITVLNSQLPDATAEINNIYLECANRQITIDYTIFNINSTDVLPANVPIAIYADNELIGNTLTLTELAIGASENGQITVSIPESLPDYVSISIAVDDTGNGFGVVTELNELNNDASQDIQLLTIPTLPLESIKSCDEGYNTAFFDLIKSLDQIDSNGQPFSFFETLDDLDSDFNEIINPSHYQNTSVPQTVYLKVENEPCYDIYYFNLVVENCPPHVPQVFTPNNDGYNDWFNIQGLYNIFEEHKLLIYNRYGTLIFEGDNNNPWTGKANRGFNNTNKIVPTGTYFYVLNLNEHNYKVLTGWVYLNK